MTSQARLTAARLAVRLAARGINAGGLSCPLTDADKVALLPLAAAVARCMGAFDEALGPEVRSQSLPLTAARTLVRKSKTARLINGAGDLWNGDDRAHQFALLNAAADVRRSVTFARG